MRFHTATLAIGCALLTGVGKPRAADPVAAEGPKGVYVHEWQFMHRLSLAERIEAGRRRCGRERDCDPLTRQGQYVLDGYEHHATAVCHAEAGWLRCAVRWKTHCYCALPIRYFATELTLPLSRIPPAATLDPRFMYLGSYEREGMTAPAMTLAGLPDPVLNAIRSDLIEAHQIELTPAESGLLNFLMELIDEGDPAVLEFEQATEATEDFCDHLPEQARKLVLGQSLRNACGLPAEKSEPTRSLRLIQILGWGYEMQPARCRTRLKSARKWFPNPSDQPLIEYIREGCPPSSR